MWVAISKPREDGMRLMAVIGFEGVVVRLPDYVDAWTVDGGETLCMDMQDGDPPMHIDAAEFLDIANGHHDWAKVVAVHG